jgi:hypothetical protein
MRWTVSANHTHPKMHWHRWFAWFPVRVGDEVVFLETIWRKGTRHVESGHYEGPIVWWTWEYANDDRGMPAPAC